MTRKAIRCAIYTRKSSEEGLDQAYNSLDAQRDACAAYILSQAGEAWAAVPGIYDDGGFSGGTLERPALKRLMADIEAARVDVIVVYKVDRLTRSLSDFARIVELLDRKGASFVSVTQAFNTTNSMGRLTLNVLLSFAQFEREVTGERIRDKIAASKRLGMWMGGCVPLGYRVENRALVAEPDEARQVEYIFQRYLDLSSVNKVKQELVAAGIVSKQWMSQAGKCYGGKPLERGALYYMLRNRLYVGEIPHKDRSYPGQHKAIIARELFEAVQAKLDETAIILKPHRPRLTKATYQGAPLKGLIFDAAGNRMSPVSARHKGGVVYRYYVSRALQSGATPDPQNLQRTPAALIEDIVCDRLKRIEVLVGDPVAINWAQIRPYLTRVQVGLTQVVLQIDTANNPRLTDARAIAARLGPDDHVDVTDGLLTLTLPAQFSRRSGVVVALNPVATNPVLPARHDSTLAGALIRAEAWKRRLMAGDAASVEDLARQEGVTGRYIARVIRVAFLAPDLKHAILDGTLPAGYNLQTLMTQELPLDWRKQRDLVQRSRHATAVKFR